MLVAFVVLLVCLLVAFFSGVWVGRARAARGPQPAPRRRRPPPGRSGRSRSYRFFSEEGKRPTGPAAAATAPAPSVPPPPPSRAAIRARRTTLVDDVGGVDVAAPRRVSRPNRRRLAARATRSRARRRRRPRPSRSRLRPPPPATAPPAGRRAARGRDGDPGLLLSRRAAGAAHPRRLTHAGFGAFLSPVRVGSRPCTGCASARSPTAPRRSASPTRSRSSSASTPGSRVDLNWSGLAGRARPRGARALAGGALWAACHGERELLLAPWVALAPLFLAPRAAARRLARLPARTGCGWSACRGSRRPCSPTAGCRRRLAGSSWSCSPPIWRSSAPRSPRSGRGSGGGAAGSRSPRCRRCGCALEWCAAGCSPDFRGTSPPTRGSRCPARSALRVDRRLWRLVPPGAGQLRGRARGRRAGAGRRPRRGRLAAPPARRSRGAGRARAPRTRGARQPAGAPPAAQHRQPRRPTTPRPCCAGYQRMLRHVARRRATRRARWWSGRRAPAGRSASTTTPPPRRPRGAGRARLPGAPQLDRARPASRLYNAAFLIARRRPARPRRQAPPGAVRRVRAARGAAAVRRHAGAQRRRFRAGRGAAAARLGAASGWARDLLRDHLPGRGRGSGARRRDLAGDDHQRRLVRRHRGALAALPRRALPRRREPPPVLRAAITGVSAPDRAPTARSSRSSAWARRASCAARCRGAPRSRRTRARRGWCRRCCVALLALGASWLVDIRRARAGRRHG